MNQAVDRLKLLLVDDSPDFLSVASNFLSPHPNLQIVGLADSGVTALSLVQERSPDLVLMDFSMPGMNGLEATRKLKSLIEAPQIILISLHEGFVFSDSAHKAGADAFLTKSEFGERLLDVIGKLFPDLQTESINECV
ncbi:response regulator transcription factor [Pedosphaera parvula]|uniref:response regulator transcription factor n=1 Tax=Pedosphaera parvula TaxID=1032527 RepID=UPI00135F15DB|nr:response regulator transcription factor [Pedosphaera parvula]